MDMSLNTGFAVPTKCAVRKVNMNTETFIKRLPNSCDLFALGNGIGRHKRCPNGGSLHQLCRLEIPAGNIVDLARCFVRLALFINIDGENIIFLCFALQ